MRRSLVSVVTLLLGLLACDLPAASGSGSIREFREGCERLGAAADMEDEDQLALLARMEWLVVELARSGEAGYEVLVSYLRTPTSPAAAADPWVRACYTRVKIAITEAAARLGLRQAIPVLTEVVASVEPLRDPAAFHAYRQLSVAAADALATLDGREAAPVLRKAFDFAFERFRGANSAPMLHRLPAALVALGDNAWLEDRLIAWLDSDDSKYRAQAAFVAQHTLGDRLVPHLIAYLRETGDPKAVWALRQISGEEYPGLESWEAWWRLNAGRPGDERTGLPPTPEWKEVWSAHLFETMHTQFLCNKLMCWRKAGGGSAAMAALEMARRVHALDIEPSIVERLREQRVNGSEASCCRIWGSVRRPGMPRRVARRYPSTAAVSQAVPSQPDSYCGCGRPLPMALRDSVATQAERLLNAIACIKEPAPCADWRDFDLSVKVATTAAPEAQAPARVETGVTVGRPAGFAGRSDATVEDAAELKAPAGLRWRLAGTLLEWNAVEDAAGYHIYRGDRASLRHLADSAADGCLRLKTLTSTSWRYLLEIPPRRDLLWYLVVAVDSTGREGGAGGPAARPRIVDSEGLCPGR